MGGYLFAAACVALLCACYCAGRAALPQWWTVAVAAGALCVPAAQFAMRPMSLAVVTGVVSGYLVFAALPLLAGRYVAQQRMVADRERLGERLRIARDMHDSLGRRLSLAAVQAAALEVADLPAPQRAAAARLGTAVRASVTELHEILHVLRGERGTARGMSAVNSLLEEFESAAVAVSLRSRGTPRPLPADSDQAAYRVIEEGLTNAVRHAPGRPVNATVTWEADAVLISVVNTTDSRAYAPGSGLVGLTERLRNTGGFLHHELSGGQFRLRAAIPVAVFRGSAGRSRLSASALGLVVGVLLLVILPVTVLLGVS